MPRSSARCSRSLPRSPRANPTTSQWTTAPPGSPMPNCATRHWHSAPALPRWCPWMGWWVSCCRPPSTPLARCIRRRGAGARPGRCAGVGRLRRPDPNNRQPLGAHRGATRPRLAHCIGGTAAAATGAGAHLRGACHPAAAQPEAEPVRVASNSVAGGAARGAGPALDPPPRRQAVPHLWIAGLTF